MKVLKAGDTNRRERWVMDSAWECGNCSAVLEFEPKDFEAHTVDVPEANASTTHKALVQLHDSQMDGEYFTTTCAYCGMAMSGSKGQGLPLVEFQAGTAAFLDLPLRKRGRGMNLGVQRG